VQVLRKEQRYDHVLQKSLVKKCLCAVVCLVLYCGSLHAQRAVTREATIKAVFLFNFTQFVEWPATAHSSPTSPFVIGILGDDPFGTYLDETIAGEKVDGHPLMIKRYRDAKEVRGCHILFINAKEMEQKDLFSLLAGKNILTVGDAKNFAKQGGMIRLATENNKIKLEINAETAKEEKLVISSKLLRIATIFDPSNH
jgi:hypothetical protein